ncbi:MAG: ATP-binding protein [Caldilineaceae bacterium]
MWDSGPSSQPHFDPFFTTARKGGTGLGLHIVYSLITQTMMGRIRCESQEDQGTQFVMELPVNNPHKPEEEPTTIG